MNSYNYVCGLNHRSLQEVVSLAFQVAFFNPDSRFSTHCFYCCRSFSALGSTWRYSLLGKWLLMVLFRECLPIQYRQLNPVRDCPDMVSPIRLRSVRKGYIHSAPSLQRLCFNELNQWTKALQTRSSNLSHRMSGPMQNVPPGSFGFAVLSMWSLGHVSPPNIWLRPSLKQSDQRSNAKNR
jgi:hypothetical protein